MLLVRDRDVDAINVRDAVLWTDWRLLRMLGVMWSAFAPRNKWAGCRYGRQLALALATAGLPLAGGGSVHAQSCTTQAKMTPEQRSAVGEAAYRLATAVAKGDSVTVQAGAISVLANSFAVTANLIHATATSLGTDTLAVTQAYLLDASGRTASDTSDAEFSCPLAGSAAETDFSIAGLPPGRYAFAMVEGTGAQPWLLAFLLQADTTGGWKMAGFYPHRREAAGHAGLWYWTVARADAKAGKPWLAWLLYGQADELLRPASFLSTTNLDRLRAETRAVTPPALSAGLNDTTPLVLPGANGADYRITGLASAPSEDGKQLNLVMHLRAEASSDPAVAATRNLAAGAALLTAHPELRPGFDNLWVIDEMPNSNPFVTERPIGEYIVGK